MHIVRRASGSGKGKDSFGSKSKKEKKQRRFSCPDPQPTYRRPSCPSTLGAVGALGELGKSSIYHTYGCCILVEIWWQLQQSTLIFFAPSKENSKRPQEISGARILESVLLQSARQFWWNCSCEVMIWKCFEGKMLIRTPPTTPLQIFCKTVLNSFISAKSIIYTDVNFWRNSLAWMG